MLDLLKLRFHHNRPVIRDLRAARAPAEFPGFPLLRRSAVLPDARRAQTSVRQGRSNAVPFVWIWGDAFSAAIASGPVPPAPSPSLPVTVWAQHPGKTLVIASGQSAGAYEASAIGIRKEIRSLFGRSLKLRQVSAAGCNGCEMELAAAGNVNFDMGRFGIEFTASPRHADGIVITGPVSRNMAPALRDTWLSVPEPKIVVAAGACAISGGVFADSPELDRAFFDQTPVDLFVPGCPPHPLTFIHALLNLLGRMP